MLRTCVRVVAAVVLTAAAYAASPVAPASAAACPTAHGVTVVVDFHELGGGVQTGCVTDGAGDPASSLFPAAGFSLSYAQRQPGFVCRVEGVPAEDPCVNTPPADAYWALFWSDGKSGTWSYSSIGVGGLKVPEGGYVAFSWTGSSTRSNPGFSPAPHPSATPTPSPTHSASPSAHPSQHGSAAPTATATDPAESPSASASESASESAKAKPGGKKGRPAKPSASAASETPSAEATQEEDAFQTTATEPTDDPDDGGLPSWVAPAVIALLFGGAGAAAVVRRRRGTPGA